VGSLSCGYCRHSRIGNHLKYHGKVVQTGQGGQIVRLGHVIYVVKDLDAAVNEWRKKGFTVEYGRTKNPMNALIYFSEGPYIELLKDGKRLIKPRIL